MDLFEVYICCVCQVLNLVLLAMLQHLTAVSMEVSGLWLCPSVSGWISTKWHPTPWVKVCCSPSASSRDCNMRNWIFLRHSLASQAILSILTLQIHLTKEMERVNRCCCMTYSMTINDLDRTRYMHSWSVETEQTVLICICLFGKWHVIYYVIES